MKTILLIVSFLLGVVSAQTHVFKGIALHNFTLVPVEGAEVIVSQDGKIKSAVLTAENGEFEFTLKTNQNYTLEVSKASYNTEKFRIILNEAFIKENQVFVVKMEAGQNIVEYDDLKSGAIKKVPNPSAMEDIGNISNLPEGARILEVISTKTSDQKKSGFNVQTKAVEKDNVDTEQLKEAFNRQLTNMDQNQQANTFVKENTIFYLSGQYKLSAEAESFLEETIKKLSKSKNAVLVVATFADANQESLIGDHIAKLRAEEITRYLTSKGVAFSQLQIKVAGNKYLENRCYEGVTCTDAHHQENRKAVVEIMR
jgi:outer membrane protein OmpA-like peptidoglycan-associated protein